MRRDQPGEHVLANLAAGRLGHRPRDRFGAVVPVALIPRLGGGGADVLPAQPRGLPGGARFLEQLGGAGVIGGVNDLAQPLRVDGDSDAGAGGVQSLRQPTEAGSDVARELGGGLALPAGASCRR